MENVVDLPAQRVAVTVYEKPYCQPCRATKRWLDARGIEYTLVSLADDPAALNYVTGLGHTQAPVVVLGDETHWAGFDPVQLAYHLDPAA